ncbi:hypothetical protein B0H19DRAFT_1273228 [Mycena capillaripes]|nr:hypothetical protein B0H19DRAFT_1273228 [Mycena capillaripes]
MFLRRLFVLSVSALTYLTSVETPEVSGVGTVALSCSPSLPICVDDPYHDPWSASSANLSGEHEPFQLLDDLGWFTHYPPPHVIPIARPASVLDKVLTLLHRLPRFDLDNVCFVYGVTYEFAQHHSIKARVAWWIAFVDVLKAVVMLGGMSAAVALGFGEAKDSLEFVAALDMALRPALDWLRVSANKAQRDARCSLNLVQSVDLVVLITFFPLPCNIIPFGLIPFALPDLRIDLANVDLGMAFYTFIATLNLAGRLRARTGVSCWISAVGACKTGLALGGTALRAVVEASEGKHPMDAVVSRAGPLLRTCSRRCRRRAWTWMCKVPRIARTLLGGIQSDDVLFIISYFGLPFDVPLAHLLCALALNGNGIFLLASSFEFRVLPGEISSPPKPLVHRDAKRYRRDRRGKAKIR